MQFNNLGKQWESIRESVLNKIDSIGLEGSYINGKSVSDFEDKFAKYFDVEYSVGVSNGTDGLKLALQVYNLSENIFYKTKAFFNKNTSDISNSKSIVVHSFKGNFYKNCIISLKGFDLI
jgi:dTDP-4-amino-4,6-dideoxygalactose transaminase